jgi:dipeptidyl aminopeptidase/acylaminoacyl peptidase
MINRRNLLKAISALGMGAPHVSRVSAQDGTAGRIDARRKGVMLMNRIGPSASELYIANTDGSGEREFLQNSVFEHNASFAPDRKSVLFTSERNGAGQSDVFRARLDGTGIEPVATGPAVEDQAALSPDGTRVAFVSTREGYRANVWVLDLKSGATRNLTGAEDVQGDPSGPNGFFRPAWSPDNQGLAFSSDRNTDWRGHDDGHGWEHTQELSVYVIRAAAIVPVSQSVPRPRCHMCPLSPRSRSVTDDIDVPETEAPGTGFAKAVGERSVVEGQR